MVKKAPTKKGGMPRKSSLSAVEDAVGAGEPNAPVEAPEEKKVIERETPDVPEPRRKLVAWWQDEIRADKEHFKPAHTRMRESMQYARQGANKTWVKAKKYTVPIINRHINLSVAALYAKNPKAVAKPRPKLNFVAWDGTMESAKAAMQGAMMGDPKAIAVMAEIEDARSNDVMLKRLGKTLEILFGYYTGENMPTFKVEMKAHVRRAKTCSASFIELGFQRAMEPDPDITRKIEDVTNQITLIETRLADLADGEIDEDSSEKEELDNMLKDLQEQEMLLVSEGLTFDYPRSTEIIPHRKCKQLLGFVGADHVTREFELTADEIKATYKVDIGTCYTQYKTSYKSGSGEEGTNRTAGESDDNAARSPRKGKTTARVWRVQCRRTGEIFTLVEGYPDFVKPPTTPALKVDGFYTIFALTFNAVEDEEEIFPPSDVEYLTHPQDEYNSSRQGKREHRIANRPKYFIRKGSLEEKEKAKIQNSDAFAVIELMGMDAETKIDGLIQAFKPVPIDPNLYDVTEVLRDVMVGTGTQDANLGPTSGATATESSISENSRMSTTSSNVDDLDDHLSSIARAAGQILLANLSKETVIEIVGPGAIWPEFDREKISRELLLEVKAGSSGRPNKAAELANMERGMPYLIQIGGINPTVLGEQYADLLDMDPENLIVEGMPSIIAINAMASRPAGPGGPGVQPSTGDPATDPNQQGAQGSQNAQGPGPNENEPGAQPAYPSSTQVIKYDAKGARVG